MKKGIPTIKTSFSLVDESAKITNTAATTEAKETAAEEEKENYTRFNFICDKSIVRKIRDISRIEGISIRKIMEKALSEWLLKYEKKNGPVGQMRNRSIDDL